MKQEKNLTTENSQNEQRNSKFLLPYLHLLTRKSVAFTLAEVLITLGIIGVVAALTIPHFVQKYTERATIVKLKKVYSMLSTVNQSVVIEYGDKYHSDAATVREKWEPYLNIVKKCTNTNKKGCFASTAYDGINRKAYGWLNDGVTYLLNDGVALKIDDAHWFIVDLNGPAKPNTYGIDTFHFRFGRLEKPAHIVPSGAKILNYNFAPHNVPCNRNVSPSTHIKTCAAWVLEYENMDYLHCNDLEWGKKTKCK